MVKQANDVLAQIFFVGFFVVMGATPLVILALGILNFTRDNTRRPTIVLQALAALVIWTFLSLSIMMIFFMTVFEYPAYVSRANGLKSTAIFISGGLIYALAGVGLIYWTKRQLKRSPTVKVS